LNQSNSTEGAAPNNPSSEIIGKAHSRLDGHAKVTGKVRYSGDHLIEGVTFGYLILSTIAKGQIRSMDVSAAERSPGVLAVFSPFKSFKLYSPLRSDDSVTGEFVIPLQEPDVRYYGQIIGFVVAKTFEQARDAARLVKVRYHTETPTLTWEAGMSLAYFPGILGRKPNVWSRLANGVPSIEAALDRGAIKSEGVYTTPFEHHNPMEPHTAIAVWEGDRLTLYDSTQWVGGHQTNIAAMLGIPTHRVQVICPFVGGAFGSKAYLWTYSPVIAGAARELNRPIKAVLTREQMFTLVGHRPRIVSNVALSANSDGTLVAIRHDSMSTSSLASEYSEAASFATSRLLYRSPNIQVSHQILPLDIPSAATMRAPDEAPGTFALESAMDELALKLAIDPVQLRLLNYADVSWNNLPWSSKNLRECYRIGAERFGWSNRSAGPGKTREGDWWIGSGMATALNEATRPESSARIRFQVDGTVAVSVATHELGTGMYTILAMIAAERLGWPVEKIRPELGDSALPAAPGAFAAQSTGSVGPAVVSAADAAIERLIQFAITEPQSPFAGLKPEEVTYSAGFVRSKGAERVFGSLLEETGRFSVEASATAGPGDESAKYAFHSFGATFCEVRVNQLTAETRVSRINSVMDIGKVINPKTAKSQIIGALIMGIGMALLEETHLDEKIGRFTNANMADYHMVTHADTPHIAVEFIDKPDLTFNPLGARGAGEIGNTGVAAAIANAVYNATGKRIRNLPITPDKLLS